MNVDDLHIKLHQFNSMYEALSMDLCKPHVNNVSYVKAFIVDEKQKETKKLFHVEFKAALYLQTHVGSSFGCQEPSA